MATAQQESISSGGDGNNNNNKQVAVVVVEEASTPSSAFKFNVHAPEFVPAMSPTASPMSAPAGSSSFYSPFGLHVQPDHWSFFHDHEPVFFMPDFKFAAAAAASAQPKPTSAADMPHKIVKQVEYQFSDINLVANEFLLKIMNKDSEGYGTYVIPLYIYIYILLYIFLLASLISS